VEKQNGVRILASVAFLASNVIGCRRCWQRPHEHVTTILAPRPSEDEESWSRDLALGGICLSTDQDTNLQHTVVNRQQRHKLQLDGNHGGLTKHDFLQTKST